MRSLHMLDLSQIELGLRETCLWATFFDLDPLTARKEGWTHSLDPQKGRESTCIAAHLLRCLPRTAATTSAVPGFIALPRPNNHRIARVPFARSMLLISLYLPPCHCQAREAGLYRGWSQSIFLEVDCL